jgi:hypothetical protein
VVIALSIIRKYARAAGLNVGPILMLSYKNHALDEFLCDLIDSSKDGAFGPRKLIRCGKPEYPRLMDFTERNSAEEKKIQQEISSKMTSQRRVRLALTNWSQCSREFGNSVKGKVCHFDTLCKRVSNARGVSFHSKRLKRSAST